MELKQYPVPGQSVRPALGFDDGRRLWLILDGQTQLSPWMVLHREGLHDAAVDTLLQRYLHRGVSRSQADGELTVLQHFGLASRQRRAQSRGRISQIGALRQAIFNGLLIVLKLNKPSHAATELANPQSIYWATQAQLLRYEPGSPEHERGQALVEMGNILLARWEHQRLSHLEFSSQSRLSQLSDKTLALAEGVVGGVAGFLESVYNLVRITVEVTAAGVSAVANGLLFVLQNNFDTIAGAIRDAGLGAYQTAKELYDTIEEGMAMIRLVYSDPYLYPAMIEFMDGYGESAAELDRLRTGARVVVEVGIEVALALATLGSSLVVGALRNVGRVGPFTVKLLEHLAKFVKSLGLRARALDAGPAAGSAKGSASPSRKRNGAASSQAQGKPAANPKGQTHGKPADQPKAANTITQGEPISMVDGQEILQLHDLTFQGLVGLPFVRTYRSKNAQAGGSTARDMGLGCGWANPLGQHLMATPQGMVYVDAEGRSIEFAPVASGRSCVNSAEGLELFALEGDQFRLQADTGLGQSLWFEPAQAGRWRLSTIEDSWGNQLKVFYAPQALNPALPSRIETSQGTWVLAHDEAGHLIEISQLPAPQGIHAQRHLVLASYQYSPEGDLLAATDAAGHTEHYAYKAHVLVRRTLKSGYNIHFEWDERPNAHWRCTRQRGDPVAGQPTYAYRFEWGDQANGHTDTATNTAIDSRGGRHSYRFNARGQAVWARNPEGGVSTWQYDGQGRLLAHTDPAGHTQRWQYGGKAGYDETIAYTDVLGHTTHATHNPQGQLTRLQDAMGHEHHYQYGPQGQCTAYTNPLGQRWQYQYNPMGLLAQIIDPLGNRHQRFYNSNGQWVGSTGPLGARSIAHYDHWGRLVQLDNGAGQTTDYAYDAMGRCTRVASQHGSTQWVAYTALGSIASITDDTGRHTQYEYPDRLSQPTKRTDALGHSLHYQYDSERNLVALTNEMGQTAQFTYDLMERLVSQTGFDGLQTRYGYNPQGHLLQTTVFAPGHSAESTSPSAPLAWTSYQRDAAGRLLGSTCSDGDHASFAYNPAGQLTQACNAHSTLEWEYDACGQVTAEQQTGLRIAHQYNPMGWLKSSSWAAAAGAAALAPGQISLEYNAAGLLGSIDYNGQPLAQFEHDHAGRETTRRLANQLQIQSQYDGQGRLIALINRKTQGSDVLLARNYRYNRRNQLVSMAEHGQQRQTRHDLHYDLLDRLTHIEGPNPEAFLFDPASNLLEALQGQEASDALANQALPEPTSPNARRPQQAPGNRLQRQGNRRFVYDERGNRIEEIIERGAHQGQVTRYRYNAHNQLVEVNVAGLVTRYTYDPLGRRISKSSEQGSTTFYWNGDVLLGEVASHANRTYLFEPNSFKPLAMVQQGEVLHYHTDHLGTPQELSNSEGRIVWQARFKAYGALALASVSEVANPLRFQGQYYDEETGLHYNRHRYYDPHIGQFTTQDPIGFAGGLNVYQYAPNPVTWVDPWGLKGEEGTETGVNIKPHKGQTIYRVYGGDSKASGASWTPVDPLTEPNYRDKAGLPSGGESGVNNSGRFVIEGTLDDPSKVVLTRSALPLDGKIGGMDEYIIPNGIENGAISVKKVGGVNPEF